MFMLVLLCHVYARDIWLHVYTHDFVECVMLVIFWCHTVAQKSRWWHGFVLRPHLMVVGRTLIAFAAFRSRLTSPASRDLAACASCVDVDACWASYDAHFVFFVHWILSAYLLSSFSTNPRSTDVHVAHVNVATACNNWNACRHFGCSSAEFYGLSFSVDMLGFVRMHCIVPLKRTSRHKPKTLIQTTHAW